MAKPTGKKPDFKLKVLDKSNDRQGDIGAGWLNVDGSVTLQINPGTVLLYDPSLCITLFPAIWGKNPFTKRKVFGGNGEAESDSSDVDES